jgi:hypothetical protein
MHWPGAVKPSVRLAGGILVTVVLTACSAAGNARANQAKTSTPGITSQSAAPAETHASIPQWGSFIAAKQTPVLKADADMNGCLLGAGDPMCGIPALTFSLTVYTLGLQLQTEQRSDNLGLPPDGLSALVSQTTEAIGAMNTANDAEQKCVGKSTDACTQIAIDWDGAHDAVLSILNGWKPYTN